jgi:pyruvate,orthophosphate dikinase
VPDAQAQLDRLVDAGLATQAGMAARISPSGRERLVALLDEERATVDQTALTEAYEDFDVVNTEFKTLITAWQMLDGQTVNDHTDATYDASVIERLDALHQRFQPLLAHIAKLAPRLATYQARFNHAIDMIRQGNHSFVARPIADSYHTVWFELHEELIGLLGRTRAEEAAAGRAI